MTQQFSNAAKSLLSSGLTTSSTSLSLTDNGAAFPVATRGTGTTGTWFKVVIDDGTNLEIVYVRTHTSGSTTLSDVLRGQEGTTAYAFDAGATVGLRLTAQDFSLVQSQKVAPTVAEMVAANLSVGDYVQTLGYTTPGDGGGATYEIVSANTAVGYSEPNIETYNLTVASMRSSFDGTYWYKSGIKAYASDGSVKDTLLAPDGTTTADFLREDSTNGAHFILAERDIIGPGASTVTVSGPLEVFCHVAKYDPDNPKNARQYLTIGIACSSTAAINRASVIVDIHKTAGTVTQELYGSNLRRAHTVISSVGDYWLVLVRFDPLVAPTTATGNFQLAFGASTVATGSWTLGPRVNYMSYQGDGTSGIYLWESGARPWVSPTVMLANGLQAKWIGQTLRMSQMGATSGNSSTALLKALSVFGTSVQGTLVVDLPMSLGTGTFTIPSNVDLRFEGTGAITAVSSLTVNSQLIADNRAILPKYATVTFGSRQQSVKPSWFGL